MGMQQLHKMFKQASRHQPRPQDHTSSSAHQQWSDEPVTLATPVHKVWRRAYTPNGEPAALRLAFLTTVYPTVSHTFIRREIHALERRGHHVSRLSIRPAGVLADPVDVAEAEQTICILQRGPLRLIAAAIWMAVRPLAQTAAAISPR